MESWVILSLRITLGIVFIITGYRIFQDPLSWGESVKPWAKALLPTSLKTAMYSTAVYDVIIGIWLLSGFFVWIPALLAAIHMVQIIISVGIEGPEYRDIGLFGASIALLLLTML